VRSPALAIAWEFRQRYRWGLIALVGYLLLMVTTRLLVFDSGQVNLDHSQDLPFIAPRFAATVVVPLSIFTYWLLAVFSFGLTGNLAARESMYPARMFTLPVTTAALAGWPMLYGAAVMAGLWLATARFAVLPSGVDVPLMWPVFFAVASLAWIQVLMWMPYGFPGLRVIAAVGWLTTIDAIVFTAIERKVPEAGMIAFLAPQIPIAYLCAYVAVARARRGDVPDWRDKFARLGAIRDVLARRRDHFPSAARAQAWFEWRQHGLSLPVWVGILLPFELAFLLVPGTPALAVYTLFGVLVTPPFMAAFVAHGARKPGPHASDAEGLPPFIATQPLATSALIAAKLSMSIWSTLAAWLLVVIAIPVALTLSGTWPVVIDRARRVSDVVGTPRAVVVALLLLAGLVASTWKQLVQGLYIGLGGRGWLIKASASVTLGLVIFIEPIFLWIRDSDKVRLAIWNGLPWFLAVLVVIKMSAAAWIAPRLQASRLFNDRVLVTGAACWLAAVLTLYGVFVWLVLGPLIPRYFLLLLAILAIPLARVSAAPLALAWNRHR
jgi:hypothetical protein